MTIYNYISFDHIHENYNYSQQAQSNKYCQLSDYHETTIKYLITMVTELHLNKLISEK